MVYKVNSHTSWFLPLLLGKNINMPCVCSRQVEKWSWDSQCTSSTLSIDVGMRRIPARQSTATYNLTRPRHFGDVIPRPLAISWGGAISSFPPLPMPQRCESTNQRQSVKIYYTVYQGTQFNTNFVQISAPFNSNHYRLYGLMWRFCLANARVAWPNNAAKVPAWLRHLLGKSLTAWRSRSSEQVQNQTARSKQTWVTHNETMTEFKHPL